MDKKYEDYSFENDLGYDEYLWYRDHPEEAKKEADSRQIEDLGLSARVLKALQEGGIKTISDLSGKSEEDIESIKGIGEKAAKEILKSLR